MELSIEQFFEFIIKYNDFEKNSTNKMKITKTPQKHHKNISI